MKLAERLHEASGGARRLEALSEHVGALLPEGAKVLDVGCGDGMLDERIQQRHSHLEITGIDVLVRPEARIPVRLFDGRTIPHAEDSFDAVLLRPTGAVEGGGARRAALCNTAAPPAPI